MREEEDYMVIYKPKGVLSHPNSVWDVSKPSVVGGLYHYFNKLSVIPDSEQRERDPESP
jgi:23S rRNA-/tRNA-specific pseudouridylate synthase